MRVPGTVWKCEHCGALREDDGKCKFCRALERPYCPSEPNRKPIEGLLSSIQPLLAPMAHKLGGNVRMMHLTIGGNLDVKQTVTFTTPCCYSMVPQIALLNKVGGPFLIEQLLFGVRLQFQHGEPMSTDIIEQLGYLELHGDALNCGTLIQTQIKNIGRKGYCYLYLRGPGLL